MDRRLFAFLFGVVLLLSGGRAQLTCDRALQLHYWALQALQSCSNPATQNTELCGLVGVFESTQNSTSAPSAEDLTQSNQLMLIQNPIQNVDPWQNYLTQSVMTQTADLGEVSYVLGEISATYDGFDSLNTTNAEYYGAWQQPWWAQADIVANYARDPASNLDPLSKSDIFFKAANYYFAGVWPYPFSPEALERARNSVDAFKAGLDAHPNWSGYYFSTGFNNGTATADLSGILITPNASRPLPLVIFTGGTDYPKEMNVLLIGYAFLQRGYAILVYDGPGQGQVIRNPPYMPFYPAWQRVLSTILDYVDRNFANYVQLNNIAQAGLSLGGYLGARACSGNSDRIVACMPNPPQLEVNEVYGRITRGLADGIYGPFQFAAEMDPTSLPPGFATYFENYTAIIDTIFFTCNASSGAPAAIGLALQGQGPIDPELVYLAGGYGGAISGDETDLYNGVWQGYRNVQNFSTYPVSNITVPVIAVKGTQDDLLGGQEDDWYAQLTDSTRRQSTFITFDGPSGGALHDQVGSPYIAAAKTFAALNPIMSTRTATAGSSPAQTSG